MKKEDKQKLSDFYKDMYKDFGPIIVLAFLLLAVFPVCLYILAMTPSSIGFMTPEDARVWLTYYGAIAGGGVTLSGVAWTIHNQRKYEKKKEDERKEELAILYKPLILLTIDTQRNPALTYDKTEVVAPITLTNVGRAEAVKLVIKNHYEIIKYNMELPVLASKQEFNTLIIMSVNMFCQDPIIDELFQEYDRWKFTQYIILEYYDIFDNKYEEVHEIKVVMDESFTDTIEFSTVRIE